MLQDGVTCNSGMTGDGSDTAVKRKNDETINQSESLIGNPIDCPTVESANSERIEVSVPFSILGYTSVVFLDQATFDEPCVPFPSLEPKHKRNAAKRRKRDPTLPMHHMSTSSAMLSIALKNAPKTSKASLGRPCKPTSDSDELLKRPVGRPRIHPPKAPADPNKPRRGSVYSCDIKLIIHSLLLLLFVVPVVSKGDKLLGRARASSTELKHGQLPKHFLIFLYIILRCVLKSFIFTADVLPGEQSNTENTLNAEAAAEGEDTSESESEGEGETGSDNGSVNDDDGDSFDDDANDDVDRAGAKNVSGSSTMLDAPSSSSSSSSSSRTGLIATDPATAQYAQFSTEPMETQQIGDTSVAASTITAAES